MDGHCYPAHWRGELDGVPIENPVPERVEPNIGSIDQSLYAIDAATRREHWTFETGGSMISSPAVINGTIYVGSIDNSIYALGE